MDKSGYEDLNITGLKNKQAMANDRQEWRKAVLETKVQNGP
jgi:hypothetical protein